MKLFNAIAAAALICSPLINIAPAESRPNRMIRDTLDGGTIYYINPVGTNSVEVTLDNEYSSTGFIALRNCSTGQVRWRANDGYTRKQILGITRAACDF